VLPQSRLRNPATTTTTTATTTDIHKKAKRREEEVHRESYCKSSR
jgi:hypothetical protein